MLWDSKPPVALAPGKWPSAPLFGKGCGASATYGSTKGKSKLHGQLAADVRRGVAQRWNSFRVADHSELTAKHFCTPIANSAAVKLSAVTSLPPTHRAAGQIVIDL